MTSSYKVLIADKMSNAAISIFAKYGITADVKTGLPEDEIIKIVDDYDAIVVRSSTKITPKIIEASSRVKVLGRAGIGVDNIDIPAASKKGIIVMNTPFGNSTTTAEHAIAMIFATARQIAQASASTHAGKWEKNKFMGIEITNKTLGIIGCGNIGKIVADRANGLKMKVCVYDPFLTELKAEEMRVKKVSLDELLAVSDFITLHTPLIEATKNILNKDTLAKAKKGVIIVNCARGGLVDELALREAILSGHVGGAGFDVFSVEPAKDNPLFGLENVVCTPHLGASTFEAQENVSLQIAEQISEFLTNGKVENALNAPSLSAEESAVLKPYLELTEKLGFVLSNSINESEIQKIEIKTSGKVASFAIKPFVNAAILGVLKTHMEDVNYINAPAIAKDRGIEITTSTTENNESDFYKNLISISIVTSKDAYNVKGSVFSSTVQRLVEINGVKIETALEGSMIYINNNDKPGVVAKVGAVLADAKINIENFLLSSNRKNEDAVAFIKTSTKAGDGEIAALANIDIIKKVVRLDF